MNIELRTYNYALCIMNYELTLCVPAKPSGFPLYLCSLHFPSLKNISKFPNPRSRIPFPAPLAKDAAPIPNAMGASEPKLLTFEL